MSGRPDTPRITTRTKDTARRARSYLSQPMRLRFAPSPSGHLHVGNARTALFNWLAATGSGGDLVLRIEDTDVERSTLSSEASILDDLQWMGLMWTEGPDIGGPHAPYRQSERLDTYRSFADRLLARSQAYHCFCTPQQLETERRAAVAAGRPARYAGSCRALSQDEVQRRLAAGEAAAIRFRVPDVPDVTFDDLVRGTVSFGIDVIGDPVLMRSDGRPAYNFAVVVDDALMKITHVVRGEDHISNTPRQLLLYDALDLPRPIFAHLSLVMGPDHAPLAKRHGTTSVSEFRAKGYLPEALVNHLALIGWSPGGDEELLPLEELARRFSLNDVGRSAGVFDEDKLAWVNRHYLKQTDPGRLADLALPFFRSAGFVSQPDAAGLAFLRDVAPLAAVSVDRLDQIPERLRFLFEFAPHTALEDPEVSGVVGEPGALDVIRALAEALVAIPRLDRERFRAAVEQVRQRTGFKGRNLFHPVRVALTGRAGGMELDQAAPGDRPRGGATARQRSLTDSRLP